MESFDVVNVSALADEALDDIVGGASALVSVIDGTCVD
jgi:hypothetical protein